MTAAPVIQQSFRVDSLHPSLPGHFPHHPVVPGVVLLDRIASALEGAGAGTIARLGAVKFLAPLLPDQDAELIADIGDDQRRVRFRIERDGQVILRGDGVLA